MYPPLVCILPICAIGMNTSSLLDEFPTFQLIHPTHPLPTLQYFVSQHSISVSIFLKINIQYYLEYLQNRQMFNLDT